MLRRVHHRSQWSGLMSPMLCSWFPSVLTDPSQVTLCWAPSRMHAPVSVCMPASQSSGKCLTSSVPGNSYLENTAIKKGGVNRKLILVLHRNKPLA